MGRSVSVILSNSTLKSSGYLKLQLSDCYIPQLPAQVYAMKPAGYLHSAIPASLRVRIGIF